MKSILLEELKPCDVIMCRGEGLFSDTIALLDGGTYSHAALYIGKIDGEHRAIQATSVGLLSTTLRSISEERFADAYRFSKGGETFEEGEYLSEDVLKKAWEYVNSGVKYANDHLVILALLALTRDIPMDTFSRGFMRHVLDNASEYLFSLMDKGVKPMVCSEAVYRFFNEADENKKYRLEIGTKKFTINNCITFEDVALKESADRFIKNYMKIRDMGVLSGEYVDSCVFPKDLEESENLVLLGRIDFD